MRVCARACELKLPSGNLKITKTEHVLKEGQFKELSLTYVV